MKIAIARPDQVGPSWIPLGTDNLSPDHIRRVVSHMLDVERTLFEFEFEFDLFEFEFKIVTLNRTILDMVGPHDHQPIGYESVWVWDANISALRPLLEVKDPDWLAHFALGDLLDRNDFEPSELAAEVTPMESP